MDLDLYIALRNAGFPEENAKSFVYAINEKMDQRLPKRSESLVKKQELPTSILLQQDLLQTQRKLETMLYHSKMEVILWTVASAAFSVLIVFWFTVNQ